MPFDRQLTFPQAELSSVSEIGGQRNLLRKFSRFLAKPIFLREKKGFGLGKTSPARNGQHQTVGTNHAQIHSSRFYGPNDLVFENEFFAQFLKENTLHNFIQVSISVPANLRLGIQLFCLKRRKTTKSRFRINARLPTGANHFEQKFSSFLFGPTLSFEYDVLIPIPFPL